MGTGYSHDVRLTITLDHIGVKLHVTSAKRRLIEVKCGFGQIVAAPGSSNVLHLGTTRFAEFF